MGEIGIPRNEFLNILEFWEIDAIVRGYNHRLRHAWEQTRLTAWASANCMGGKDVKPPSEWLTFSWEKQHASQILTNEEIDNLQSLMDSVNKESAAI